METIVAALTHVLAALPAWLDAILGTVAAASAITALTPTPRDDRVLGKLYKVLEFLALNIGRAKDAPGRPS